MPNPSFPRSIADRILRRARRGEKAAVVVFRRGKPSRVFGLQEYLRQREVPRKNKIWKRRRPTVPGPDPLAAVEGRVLGPLRREDIYE